jgi:hypothetical protein
MHRPKQLPETKNQTKKCLIMILEEGGSKCTAIPCTIVLNMLFYGFLS